VRVVKPSELAAIPSDYELAEESPIPGSAAALEGKLVRGPDGKIYVVAEGQRHWVLDGRWIARSSYAGQTPVPATEAELQALSSGAVYTYTSLQDTLKANIPVFALTSAIFLFFFLSTGNHGRNLLGTRFEQASGSKLVQNWSGWQTRVILFAGFVVAIAMREPYLLSHPRFWAEEGVVWFQYASSHSIIKTILFAFPGSGYLNLTANIGAVLASITATRFGLEYAPAATTLLAFLIQVFPIALILFGRSPLFDSLWKAIAGCLIVIFAFTDTDEVWLNTINSMSFLGLISLILLFGETWNWPRWMKWGARGMLILCGLSSPYSAALLPLFMIFALRDKKREQKIHCIILIACVLVQAGVVVRTRMETAPSGAESQRRGTDVPLDVSMVNVFAGQMAYPAIGYSTRELLLEKLGLQEAWASASHFPPRPFSSSLQDGGWLCFILIAAILGTLKGSTLFGQSNMMIGAFLLLASFTCVASLGATPVGRYAFLPGLTFLLILLINVESPKSAARRYVSMFVLSYGLAAGMLAYRAFRFQDGPSWSREVQLWHADHTHRLRVWPTGWNSDASISYTARPDR
jgi:hypothetical protein